MFRSLILALIVTIVSGAAFVPAPSASSGAVKESKLAFGFLKDLGLEKPDWLPDFGGKGEEEAPAPAEAAAGGEETEVGSEGESEASE